MHTPGSKSDPEGGITEGANGEDAEHYGELLESDDT